MFWTVRSILSNPVSITWQRSWTRGKMNELKRKETIHKSHVHVYSGKWRIQHDIANNKRWSQCLWSPNTRASAHASIFFLSGSTYSNCDAMSDFIILSLSQDPTLTVNLATQDKKQDIFTSLHQPQHPTEIKHSPPYYPTQKYCRWLLLASTLQQTMFCIQSATPRHRMMMRGVCRKVWSIWFWRILHFRAVYLRWLALQAEGHDWANSLYHQ